MDPKPPSDEPTPSEKSEREEETPRPGVAGNEEQAAPTAAGFSLGGLFRRKTPQFYVQQGLRLIENQNLAQASIAFQKALELDPDHVEAFKCLGAVFFRRGGQSNLQAALAQYEEAVKRDPFDIEVYTKTASILEKLGKKKEATLERKKAVTLKALETDDKNPVANNNMGIFMLKLDRTREAIGFFKKSIAGGKNYDLGYRNLATAHLSLASKDNGENTPQDHLTQAKANVSRALEISQTVPSLLVLARILISEENFDEALVFCGKAEKIDSTVKDVFSSKKVILEKLNRMAEAQKAFETFQNLSKKSGS